MPLLIFLLIGLVAGWLASVIVRGRGLGLVGDLVAGVVGAVVGGEILLHVGLVPYTLLARIITATLGAVILLAIIKTLKKI